MRMFPAFFYTDDASVVVFGGGEEARRKVRLLAKTTAQITVFSHSPLDEAFAAEFEGRIATGDYADAPAALAAAKFAIVACRDEDCKADAVALVRASGTAMNVVDRPELCDFTVPSILERGEIVAAVGSGGAAPVLAKKVRTQLEALMPQNMGRLSHMAKAFRPAVFAALDSGVQRRQFWEAALNGRPADLAIAGDFDGAQAAMEDMLVTFSSPVHGRGGLQSGSEGGAATDKVDGRSPPPPYGHLPPQAGGEKNAVGQVHIVGAGPGDPELLTLKAFRLIQNADVVFHDRLVSDEIMDLVRRDADRVPVGKAKANHLVPQPDIHKLMIAAAHEGKRVVRLKGGDPFIFGRGGEEVEALREAGIEAQVVPGISSALGCAASAGLPLTHRDHAQSLTFVTGHAKAGGVPDLDWNALARPAQTVVVFMGVGTAGAISEKLINAGRAASTPVAVIENGTRDNEIKVFGTLAELFSMIERAGIKGPALLIIGEVSAIPAQALAQLSVETAA
jgi:uroporphyrin-III C-methyltransferase/precorrin-2 dehydrogenase/sirohydrochlorin ferrochelatase